VSTPAGEWFLLVAIFLILAVNLIDVGQRGRRK